MVRKTFVPEVTLQNDVPMQEISELKGHSSIKITPRLFLHYCSGSKPIKTNRFQK